MKSKYSKQKTEEIKKVEYTNNNQLISDFLIEVKLVRKETNLPKIQIITPEDVVNIIGKISDSDRERIIALYLDANNYLIGIQEVAIGMRTSSQVPVDSILRAGILCNASGIVIVHNHPSGDATLSKADIEVYKDIKDLALRQNMVLIDSISIGDGKYQSARKLEIN